MDLPFKKIKKQTNKPSKLHDPKSAYAQTRWRRPLHNYVVLRFSVFFFQKLWFLVYVLFVCLKCVKYFEISHVFQTLKRSLIPPPPQSKKNYLSSPVAVVERFDFNLRKLSLAEMFCVATIGLFCGGRDRPIEIQSCKEKIK